MKQKGFTLIELMIIVAIVGILGAILFGPRVNSTQDSQAAAITLFKSTYPYASAVRVIPSTVDQGEFQFMFTMDNKINMVDIECTNFGDCKFDL